MASFQWLGFSYQYQCSFRFSEFRSKKISVGSYNIRCEGRDYLGLDDQERDGKKRLRILIAGGGVGGLVLALAAKNRGYDVKVFERDLSAVRGEGRHRGPIQLLSSALAVLEAIDKDVARQIVEAGCITGNRINGLADGLSGEWFTKFDLLTPAVSRGLPITQVICRIALQDILVNAVGQDIVSNNSKVVDFVEDSNKVKVILEDGRQYEGDVLVGADGIRSKVSCILGIEPVLCCFRCREREDAVDCYQLMLELDKVAESGSDVCLSNEIVSALKRYEKKRMVRVNVVHTMSRMASKMLASYRPFMDFGSGPLSHLSTWQLRHPAIPVARIFLQIFLPQYMIWMIAGHG
ncbi:hypothetical protein TEA_010456 [Camellia sinensis var. sinensis]|uniref:FAD-binding domain-containing protein n=1 Tax=Camellia sinensis var. sinensis TaxID=542762 RepID=A0A4S4EFU6_CAMSN|nr:hypothetical protein TEA_010456 [Camellia sinensis var. sinensis]